MHRHLKRDLSKEKKNYQQYRSLNMKTSTEILIGLQQKPTTMTDWLPVISVILALIISLVAFIVLCKRRMYLLQMTASNLN